MERAPEGVELGVHHGVEGIEYGMLGPLYMMIQRVGNPKEDMARKMQED